MPASPVRTPVIDNHDSFTYNLTQGPGRLNGAADLRTRSGR
jgi:anthranilate/para-aminobenzoate synthase component II